MLEVPRYFIMVFQVFGGEGTIVKVWFRKGELGLIIMLLVLGPGVDVTIARYRTKNL